MSINVVADPFSSVSFSNFEEKKKHSPYVRRRRRWRKSRMQLGTFFPNTLTG
jgi:hypothetical protein